MHRRGDLMPRRCYTEGERLHRKTEALSCLPVVPFHPSTGAAMDPTAFDTLTRSFMTAGSRRRLLARLVAALPIAGVLAARVDGPEANAAE